MTVTSSIGVKVLEMETSLYGEKANGGLLGEGQGGDIREAGWCLSVVQMSATLEWQQLQRRTWVEACLLRLFKATFFMSVPCTSVKMCQKKKKIRPERAPTINSYVTTSLGALSYEPEKRNMAFGT